MSEEKSPAAADPAASQAEAKPPAQVKPEVKPEAKPADAPPAAEKTLVSVDQFFQTELKVATVVAAEAVPKSTKLIKMTLDLGDETRTVVGGIALAYKPEELIGQQVVLVANLQPAKLMGIESQGMVLAASIDGKPVLVRPEQVVPNGTRVK